MSALKTPAHDAPAAEWGALAASIPDWRWPWPEDASGALHVMPGFWRDAEWHVLANRRVDEWHRADNIVGICTGSGHSTIPDPDHWAWEGWLLRLLGTHPPIWSQAPHCVGLWTPRIHRPQPYMGSLGRACIAAAAANGRWPGGGA